MASSGSGAFIGNKPVVRVSALTAKRPVSQASSNQPEYHMIQIGDEIFKLAAVPPSHRQSEGTVETHVVGRPKLTEQTQSRQSYTEMPNGAPTTMIIKHDKDDSDDSFASDEASDLSVQLEEARCVRPGTTTSPNVTAFVQGPNGQYFVPVHTLNSTDEGIVLNGDLSASAVIEETTRKRELRLLKNREAAKECRRKKKDYVRCLENRVALLENQNKTLISELKSLKELYCQKESSQS